MTVEVGITRHQMNEIVKMFRDYFDFETTVEQLINNTYFREYIAGDAESMYTNMFYDGLADAFDGFDLSRLLGQ